MSQQNVNTTASESEESSPENLSDNVRFFSRLHVRDAQGNYVMATESQILAEAVLAIDYRYPTGTIFSSSNASAAYFRMKLAGREREVFAVAFLNNQHQLLAYEEIFHGSIACVEVHPQEIVRSALQHNAAAVILGHNAGGSRLAIDLWPALQANQTLSGVFMGSQLEKPDVHLTISWMLELTAMGQVEVVIEKTFPLAAAAETHAYAEENAILGRVVLILLR